MVQMSGYLWLDLLIQWIFSWLVFIQMFVFPGIFYRKSRAFEWMHSPTVLDWICSVLAVIGSFVLCVCFKQVTMVWTEVGMMLVILINSRHIFQPSRPALACILALCLYWSCVMIGLNLFCLMPVFWRCLLSALLGWLVTSFGGPVFLAIGRSFSVPVRWMLTLAGLFFLDLSLYIKDPILSSSFMIPQVTSYVILVVFLCVIFSLDAVYETREAAAREKKFDRMYLQVLHEELLKEQRRSHDYHELSNALTLFYLENEAGWPEKTRDKMQSILKQAASLQVPSDSLSPLIGGVVEYFRSRNPQISLSFRQSGDLLSMEDQMNAARIVFVLLGSLQNRKNRINGGSCRIKVQALNEKVWILAQVPSLDGKQKADLDWIVDEMHGTLSRSGRELEICFAKADGNAPCQAQDARLCEDTGI